MNIGEANAVQRLLQYVLMDHNDPKVATSEQACEAAVELADRSNAALHTGMHGEHVRQAWPDIDLPAARETATGVTS